MLLFMKNLDLSHICGSILHIEELFIRKGGKYVL